MAGNLPNIGLDGAEGLEIGKSYVVPSGLGGVFDVVLLSLSEESGATVRVDMKPGGEMSFHGWTFCVKPSELRRN